jgi:hypothetical protein
MDILLILFDLSSRESQKKIEVNVMPFSEYYFYHRLQHNNALSLIQELFYLINI